MAELDPPGGHGHKPSRGFLYRLVSSGDLVAQTLTAAMMAAVVAGVIARAVFTAPMAWVFEFSGYALLALTFFATAKVARDNGHVQLEVMPELLSAGRLRILDLFSLTMQILIASVLTGAGLWVAIGDYHAGIATDGYVRVSRWIIIAIIPLGGALLTLQLIRSLRALWRGEHGPGGTVSTNSPRFPPEQT